MGRIKWLISPHTKHTPRPSTPHTTPHHTTPHTKHTPRPSTPHTTPQTSRPHHIHIHFQIQRPHTKQRPQRDRERERKRPRQSWSTSSITAGILEMTISVIRNSRHPENNYFGNNFALHGNSLRRAVLRCVGSHIRKHWFSTHANIPFMTSVDREPHQFVISSPVSLEAHEQCSDGVALRCSALCECHDV